MLDFTLVKFWRKVFTRPLEFSLHNLKNCKLTSWRTLAFTFGRFYNYYEKLKTFSFHKPKLIKYIYSASKNRLFLTRLRVETSAARGRLQRQWRALPNVSTKTSRNLCTDFDNLCRLGYANTSYAIT